FREGDPFCTWGEPETPEGWDEHLVIGANDLGTVRALMESLDAHNEPSTATTFQDWSVDVEVPGVNGVRSWWDWQRENPDRRCESAGDYGPPFFRPSTTSADQT